MDDELFGISGRELLERIPQAVLVIDTEKDRILEANSAAEKLFKFSRDELRASSFRDVNPPQPDGADPKKAHAARIERMRRNESFAFRWYLRDGAGRIFPARIHVAPLPTPGMFVSFHTDLSEEAMLVASENRYRAIADATTDVVGIADGDGNTQYLNPAGRRLLGWDEADISSRHVSDFHPPEAAERLAKEAFPTAVKNGVWEGEAEFRTRDGKILALHQVLIAHTNTAGQVDFFSTLARDVSMIRQQAEEQRALETKLQQAQKLESLGVLAGGIAHDFNNLLAVILSNVGFVLSNASVDEASHSALKDIEAASSRAAGLSRQMLEYSGRRSLQVEAVALRSLAQELVHLLEASLSKNATLRIDLPEDLPLVAGSASQLGQVIMNLLTNASDALGDELGTLSLSASAITAEREMLAGYLHDDIEPGAYICLEVADSGAGIAPEAVTRIFDPFYSTKFTGRGLGLASVLGIVRSHHGGIKVTSELGRGTTIKLLLPVHRGDTEPTDGTTKLEDWRGSGTVLVVDDELAVRKAACRILELVGFDVLEAADGTSALEIFRRDIDSIRFVLLDLTMPGKSGFETLESLRQLKRDVIVILSSGYHPASDDDLKLRITAPFLSKPYSFDEFVTVIRDVLNEAGTARSASSSASKSAASKSA